MKMNSVSHEFFFTPAAANAEVFEVRLFDMMALLITVIAIAMAVICVPVVLTVVVLSIILVVAGQFYHDTDMQNVFIKRAES